MKKLIFLALLTVTTIKAEPLPTPYNWLNESVADIRHDFQSGFNTRHVILLDIIRQARMEKVDGKPLFMLDIVFSIDKGYGYSVGPFKGTLYLSPLGDGSVKWVTLVFDQPFGPIYIN
jgi:hypothetical protein